MKKLLFIISAVLASLPLVAQISSAKVTYEETISLNIGTSEEIEPGTKALLSQLPQSFSKTYELIFNEKASLFTQKENQEKEDVTATHGDVSITFITSDENPDVYYVDIANNITKQKRSILGRPFQVEDEVEKIDWTITNATETDQKSTLPVQKAIGITAKGDTLTAWYTTSIPVSTGPKAYGGLPGLIVKLINGKTTYQLTHIELLETPAIVEPPFNNGKTVSLKKFYATEKKKTEALYKGDNVKVISIGG